MCSHWSKSHHFMWNWMLPSSFQLYGAEKLRKLAVGPSAFLIRCTCDHSSCERSWCSCEYTHKSALHQLCNWGGGLAMHKDKKKQEEELRFFSLLPFNDEPEAKRSESLFILSFLIIIHDSLILCPQLCSDLIDLPIYAKLPVRWCFIQQSSCTDDRPSAVSSGDGRVHVNTRKWRS